MLEIKNNVDCILLLYTKGLLNKNVWILMVKMCIAAAGLLMHLFLQMVFLVCYAVSFPIVTLTYAILVSSDLVGLGQTH